MLQCMRMMHVRELIRFFSSGYVIKEPSWLDMCQKYCTYASDCEAFTLALTTLVCSCDNGKSNIAFGKTYEISRSDIDGNSNRIKCPLNDPIFVSRRNQRLCYHFRTVPDDSRTIKKKERKKRKRLLLFTTYRYPEVKFIDRTRRIEGQKEIWRPYDFSSKHSFYSAIYMDSTNKLITSNMERELVIIDMDGSNPNIIHKNKHLINFLTYDESRNLIFMILLNGEKKCPVLGKIYLNRYDFKYITGNFCFHYVQANPDENLLYGVSKAWLYSMTYDGQIIHNILNVSNVKSMTMDMFKGKVYYLCKEKYKTLYEYDLKSYRIVSFLLGKGFQPRFMTYCDGAVFGFKKSYRYLYKANLNDGSIEAFVFHSEWVEPGRFLCPVP